MRLRPTLRIAPALVSLLCLALPVPAAEPYAGKPPATKAEDVVDTYGDVAVHDPYRWLEDQTSSQHVPGSTRRTSTPRRTCARCPVGTRSLRGSSSF